MSVEVGAANTLPFDDLTSNRRDYDGKRAERATSYRPEGDQVGPSGDFDDGTTNKRDFTPKKAERTQAFLPTTQVEETGLTWLPQDAQPKDNLTKT